MESFLHGVEIVEIDTGPRPIRTVRSSVIGLIGTAAEADPEKFPLNTPVLIAGRRTEAAGLGTVGTLPSAIDDIFDQAGAMIVVIRIAEGDGEEGPTTLSNIIGGVDNETGERTGVQAFLDAESKVFVTPRILVAAGFSHEQALVTEMVTIAERLRAVILADGPNITDTEAINYRQQFGSSRVFIIDPWVRVYDTQISEEVMRPASARVAGLIAKTDNDLGFWHSPSNKEINGIVGTSRAIDFQLGDRNARANYLNENDVATIIQKEGFRLWGNRTCSSDPKWAFLSVRRTADMINESLLRAHMWAVDRNINKTYLSDVLESVNNYLRHLKAVGAIINGQAWADPELNTPDQIEQGHVYFDFDFSANYPAEHITFRSHLTNDYLVEILPELVRR